MHQEEEIVYLHSRGYELRVLRRTPEVVASPLLHVFFHGQVDRARFVPPVYHRRRSSLRLEAICLFASDPVLLFSREPSIGWFLLGDDEFWPRLDDLTARVCAENGLSGIAWHGPSAGGYVAIRNALRSRTPGLAFAVGPQNDPRRFPYWREFAPTAAGELAGQDVPPITELLRETPPAADRAVYITVNDRDYHHLRFHIEPIFTESSALRNVHISLLRNGLGHERITEVDYWTGFAKAVDMFGGVGR
ncbi:hypothetical protein [Streptosporangium carneum]|uniref:Alpha/beta hydrolase n=1 Tax=Streptosporangium carneum TaxID=47481 RepID=A0A9W6IB50_9ACTN|nr:hypothetical protein [Streptosporangium carneum]GLK14928.1 hypothetical protein GCM10017600_83410 [Streptosporangium carneum]